MARTVNFDEIVTRLDGVIAELDSAGLYESVALLNIARLDLVLRANGFSEGDLEDMLDSLRGEDPASVDLKLVAGRC
jgi:hypothetical protein